MCADGFAAIKNGFWNLKDTKELIYKIDSQTQKTDLCLLKGEGKGRGKL